MSLLPSKVILKPEYINNLSEIVKTQVHQETREGCILIARFKDPSKQIQLIDQHYPVSELKHQLGIRCSHLIFQIDGFTPALRGQLNCRLLTFHLFTE